MKTASKTTILGASIVVAATIWAFIGINYIPGWSKMGIVGGEIMFVGRLLKHNI